MLPKYLSIYEFVNADEIAGGLNPLDREGQAVAAARIMIGRIKDLTAEGKNFAFETTCAGRSHLTTLSNCKAAGYETSLVFLWLPTLEMAIERVRIRVKKGGHDVPSEIIKRRYKKGLENLVHGYLPIVDEAVIYDNTNGLFQKKLPVIAKKEKGRQLEILENEIWQKIMETTDA